MIYALATMLLGRGYAALLIFNLCGMFVCCVVCHGELAYLKPAPRHLTSFYLSLSFGGALGGLLVAVLAPSILSADLDLNIVLPAVVLIVLLHFVLKAKNRARSPWLLLTFGAALVALAADTAFMATKVATRFASVLHLERNFYGPLRVTDSGTVTSLANGNILHGNQFVDVNKQSIPTSYYGPMSGVGLALNQLKNSNPALNVGIVGLGAGTIAAYARPADRYRFYEINPADIHVAKEYFTYLSHCGRSCDIVLGDARLSLENEKSQKYDLMAIDAFSGDSIPMHLLTREALNLYKGQLRPGGILAVHVSNIYIDLAPVVAVAAKQLGMTARILNSDGDAESLQAASSWVIATTDPDLFKIGALAKANSIPVSGDYQAWTDDYSNLWKSLR